MINCIAGINMVTFFDNFLTIGVVAGILIFQMMDVTWTGKYTVFHFLINYVTESLLYHSIISTRKKYEK